MSGETSGMDASSGGGMAELRLRTPHDHDVLAGRGGGVNSHEGNTYFRQWVNDRKERYALAGSKKEKGQVAQEVIDIVRNQNPPGRFLRKDALCSGWVELDEAKFFAKTSQALREGAPKIRAGNQDSLVDEKRAKSKRLKSQKSTSTPLPQGQQQQPSPPLAIASSPTDFSSSMFPTTVAAVNSSTRNGTVNPVLSGQKRAHAGQTMSSSLPSSQQQQHHHHRRHAAVFTMPEVMNRQAAIAELRVNVEEAKRQKDSSFMKKEDHNYHNDATLPRYPAPVVAPLPGSAEASMKPAAKRVRVEHGGTVLLPTDATPPLTAADVPEHKVASLPPLNLSHVKCPGSAGSDNAVKKVNRKHSLSFSGDSFSPNDDEWASSDFINPFEDEGTTPPSAGVVHPNYHRQHHHHHAAVHHRLPEGVVKSSSSSASASSTWHRQPRPDGAHHDSRAATMTASNGDDLSRLAGNVAHSPATTAVAAAEVLSSLPLTPSNTATTTHESTTQPQSASAALDSPSKTGVRVRSSLSSRSLTSILSDLPDEFNNKFLETEFAQGVKAIYDVLHQAEDEIIPAYSHPFHIGGDDGGIGGQGGGELEEEGCWIGGSTTCPQDAACTTNSETTTRAST